MLRSEFRFPLDRWPQRLLATVLGEAFMGFLAIVSAGLTLFPMLFAVKPVVDASIDTAQWGIIGWFAFEYVFALASAPRKVAFLINPWRLLDLATIVIPLTTLLPSVTTALRSSPVLRLVRLVRLITLGVRVSGVTARHRGLHEVKEPNYGPVKIKLMADAPEFEPQPASWEKLLKWLHAPGREWFHVAHASRDELAEMNKAAGLPTGFLESHLFGTSYPHLASARHAHALFLWLPEMPSAREIERHGMLFVLQGEGLLSLARRPTNVMERLTAPVAGDEAEKTPFAARMLGLVLDRVMHQNERLIGTFEHELRRLEDVPIRESSPTFFEQAFRLKKELSTTQADLWRLKGILGDIAEGRVALSGKSEAALDVFRRLSTTAEYLYETVVNVRDEVVSVIELHLNIVSFDMNRVMRVLAVVSVLGLIPAVIGGLFGMNLVDNPWPFTLPQVAFAVVFGMVVTLYFFFVKGWLR
jgi:Mg2+ and Co2+ transporter CorA